MLAKILTEHFSVRLRLLGYPALFEILPTIIGLLASVNYCVSKELPVREDVQFLHFKNAYSGVVGDEFIIAGYCRIMPL